MAHLLRIVDDAGELDVDPHQENGQQRKYQAKAQNREPPHPLQARRLCVSRAAAECYECVTCAPQCNPRTAQAVKEIYASSLSAQLWKSRPDAR